MSENKKASTAESVDFEQSMKELDSLVNALENGDMSLEDALTAFEKGVNLTKTCQQQLAEAKQKVSLLVGEGNDLQLEDFESDEQ